MKFTHILVPRSYKKLLVRTVMDSKLSLQYILLPSYFGDKLHRASYCHKSSFHLILLPSGPPPLPSLWQSHQSLSRECRIRSADSRVSAGALDTLSVRPWERGTKAFKIKSYSHSKTLLWRRLVRLQHVISDSQNSSNWLIVTARLRWRDKGKKYSYLPPSCSYKEKLCRKTVEGCTLLIRNISYCHLPHSIHRIHRLGGLSMYVCMYL